MRKIMLVLVLILSACSAPRPPAAVSSPSASQAQAAAASGSAAASGTDLNPPPSSVPDVRADLPDTPPSVDPYPAPMNPYPFAYPPPDVTPIITEATAVPPGNPPGPAAASTTIATLRAGAAPLFRNGVLDDASFVDAEHGWVVFEGTIYATENGGATWEMKYASFAEAPAGRPKQIDFVARDRGFMVGGELWQGTSGVFATTDGGATWTRMPVGAQDDIVEWTDFVDPQHGWVAVTPFPDPRRVLTPSLLRTADGGQTWQPASDPCPPASHPYASAAANGRPRASAAPGTDPSAAPSGAAVPQGTGPAEPAPPDAAPNGSPQPDAVLVSPPVDVGPPASDPYRMAFNFRSFSFSSPTHGAIVCAFGDEYPPQKQIFRTADGGNTWQPMTLPPIELPYEPHIFFLDDTSGWIGGEYGKLAATTDGGATWQPVPVVPDDRRTPVGHPRFVSAQEGYAVAMNGLWHTTDGGATWRDLLARPRPYGALHMFDAERGIATAGQQIIETHDGGNTWQQIGVLPPQCSRWDRSQLQFADPNTGFLLGNIWQAINLPSALCRTVDGGRTWTSLAVPEGVYTGIALVDGKTGYVAGGVPGVQPLQRTHDGGATWEQIPSDLTIDGPVDFWTSTDGWAVSDEQIFATGDGGQTWRAVPLGYHARVFDVVDGGVAWVLADDCAEGMCMPLLIRSTDGGATWTRVRFDAQPAPTPDYPSGYPAPSHGPNPPSGGDDALWGVANIAFADPTHGVLLLQDGRTWHTADGGQTWVEQQ